MRPDWLGRGRQERPVRERHVPGGSRWCYGQGCGHEDCYRAEADYRWRRVYGVAAPLTPRPNFGVEVVAEGAMT